MPSEIFVLETIESNFENVTSGQSIIIIKIEPAFKEILTSL